jgi:recombination protein U
MLYPNNIKKDKKAVINYGNRGMDLESLINETNEYYLNNDIALIFKKPTPIGVAKVSYNEFGKQIEKAYFKEQSTLDYNGLYKGKYIEFDAKETQNKTSFPISNVHPHQIKHIRNVIKHQGISFLIIKMNSLYYLLLGNDFIDFIDNNSRKSIPYEYLKNKSYEIKEKYNPSLDYLKIIDDILLKEDLNGKV